MKKVIVSVADLTIFDDETGELIAESKTMVNTGMTVSVTNDVLRGGKGNMPVYVLNHDKNMEVNATDVCYNLEYFAINNGSDIIQGAQPFAPETVTVAAGSGSVTKTPLLAGGSTAYGWVTYGTVVNEKVPFTGKTFMLADSTYNGDVCIKYYKDDLNAKEVRVYADVKLKTYKLIYDIDIGLQSETSDGSTSIAPFGKMQVIVDKAQPTGNWELALASDSASQPQLNFIALATNGTTQGCSSSSGTLARIIEMIDDSNWYDNVIDLVASLNGSDNISLAVGETATLNVRAITSTGGIVYLNTPDALTHITASTADASTATATDNTITGVAAGSTTITYTLTAKPEINTEANITVA